MDTLKINSSFMKTIISKIIKEAIKKKIGFPINVAIQNLECNSDEKTTDINISVKVSTETSNLMNFLKDRKFF